MSPADPKRPHTLADHLLGALVAHSHGDDDDHDHDHDHDAMAQHTRTGQDVGVELVSIGVDVGSSGTQVAFSRLRLEGTGGGAAGRLSATRRVTLYQSPVALTPYVEGNKIDEEKLGGIVERAFAAAGLDPDGIDCGVVILTGTARERANAEAITRRLAEDCGDIVSASAGHHMEARLAAYGSGAVGRSLTSGRRFLNIDIGGGTTKLAACAQGCIEATAALAIGGRQVATDTKGSIVRLEPFAAARAARLGLDWRVGATALRTEMELVAGSMADDLVAVLRRLCDRGDSSGMDGDIWITAPLVAAWPIDGMIVSGGVGEYVYGRETRDFCDLGRALGRALAARIDRGEAPWPLLPAAECIRATVLGAAGYTVQLSGRTGWIPAPGGLLPARNLPVLHPACRIDGEIDAGAVAGAIERHLATFDIAADDDHLVFALRWQGLPEYARLRAFAEGLAAGIGPRGAAGRTLRVILDGDIARSLGAILAEELGLACRLMVLDGIALDDFDFVDLGRIRLPSETVPVTIKTLVFRDDPGQKRKPARRRGQQL